MKVVKLNKDELLKHYVQRYLTLKGIRSKKLFRVPNFNNRIFNSFEEYKMAVRLTNYIDAENKRIQEKNKFLKTQRYLFKTRIENLIPPYIWFSVKIRYEMYYVGKSKVGSREILYIKKRRKFLPILGHVKCKMIKRIYNICSIRH